MIESLLVAGFTAIVVGAFMLGSVGLVVRRDSQAIKALHSRFDDLVLALIRAGIVNAEMLARPPRTAPRGEAA